MDLDSNSKPCGYIVLCRTCSHCTDLDSDPYSLFLNPSPEFLPKSVSGNVNEQLDNELPSFYGHNFLFVDGRETDGAERLRDSGGGGGEDLQEPGSSAENQVLYWKRLTKA